MPVVQQLVESYTLWHTVLPHLPKTQRYTLGQKIDSSFVLLIEAVVTAATAGHDEKTQYLQLAIRKLDLVKFFLYLGWTIHAIDQQQYLALSEQLDEIGRQLGAWRRQQQRERPARSGA